MEDTRPTNIVESIPTTMFAVRKNYICRNNSKLYNLISYIEKGKKHGRKLFKGFRRIFG